ncbi:MAG: hypothetical protein WBW76_14590 [Candidatus Cybelea sp.]
MSHLEGGYDQVGRRLDSLDSHVDRLAARIDHFETSINARIDALAARLDVKIDARFTWTVGIIVGTWAGTIATMIALFLHR